MTELNSAFKRIVMAEIQEQGLTLGDGMHLLMKKGMEGIDKLLSVCPGDRVRIKGIKERRYAMVLTHTAMVAYLLHPQHRYDISFISFF